jgi:hypothetical protein
LNIANIRKKREKIWTGYEEIEIKEINKLG